MDSYEVQSMIDNAISMLKSDLEYYADRKAEDEASYVERRLRSEIDDLRRRLSALEARQEDYE